MGSLTLIQDLYAYNDWANEKLLKLSEGLSDEQMDAEQPMGFNSLRATLYHMAFAERLWLDRWQTKPWAPLSHDATGASLQQLSDEFRAVANERNALLEAESNNNYSRMVDYMNSSREPFCHRLRELLVHVVNHAIHHRAQALNFLRPWGRAVPGGLDYLFYRLARPTVANEAESSDMLRQRGFEIGDAPIAPPTMEPNVIQRYCQYGDWVMEIILPTASSLSAAELDRPFEMGVGSLRKTLHHLCDAEKWWYRNWTEGPSAFAKLDEAMPIEAFVDEWRQTASRRDNWLANKSSSELAGRVTATPGGAIVHFRLAESVLQLCGHGTHHRAQAINMLRRLGHKLPATDYVVWIRGVGAPVA